MAAGSSLRRGCGTQGRSPRLWLALSTATPTGSSTAPPRHAGRSRCVDDRHETTAAEAHRDLRHDGIDILALDRREPRLSGEDCHCAAARAIAAAIAGAVGARAPRRRSRWACPPGSRPSVIVSPPGANAAAGQSVASRASCGRRARPGAAGGAWSPRPSGPTARPILVSW